MSCRKRSNGIVKYKLPLLHKSNDTVKVKYDPMQELWESQQETRIFWTSYGILFSFDFYSLSFIAVYTLKCLHTLIMGKESKFSQQTSAVLPAQGGKASHCASATAKAKRNSDPQDKKPLELSRGHVFLLVLEV